MGMAVVIVTLTAGAIFGTAYYFLSMGFAEESAANVTTMRKVVERQLRMTEQKYLEEIMLISHDAAFAEAVAKGETAQLVPMAKKIMAELHSDFMTISDTNGKVLARGHSDKTGDSVLDQGTVQLAIKGESSVGIVSGTVVPFTIRAGTPIRWQGKVVGTASVGTSLVKEAFVDDIKSYTNLEMTVFKGDTRMMTTLVNQGKRAVGTRLDNQKVLDTVLQRGEMFLARNRILGKDYQTAYWPMKGMDGKAVGMWFIGMPVETILAAQNNVIYSTLGAVAILLPLMLLIAWVFARAVARPIGRTTEFAKAVSEGHLEMQLDVRSNDEVGTLASALRAMVRTLKDKISEAQQQTERAGEETRKAHEAMAEAEEARREADRARRQGMLHAAGELQGVVEILSAASEQLSAQIEQSSRGSELQSQRTGETATAMEEMNSTVLEVARSAGEASETSAAARSKAEEGASIVRGMVSGINKVHQHSTRLEQDMGNLGKRAEEIGRIMGVISDIADQTNLLALNAAIEAARAGDAGRGFAVVADEVRKLAEKTMLATKEVGDAIGGIQQGTRSSIEQVSQTVREIVEVTGMAESAGQSLVSIVELSERSSDQVRSIATASEEQSASSEQISRSVDEINRITAETSDGMRQSALAVTELAAQAQRLKSIIEAMQRDNA